MEDDPCCCWTGGCGFAVLSFQKQCQQRNVMLHLQQRLAQRLPEYNQAQALLACCLVVRSAAAARLTATRTRTPSGQLSALPAHMASSRPSI